MRHKRQCAQCAAPCHVIAGEQVNGQSVYSKLKWESGVHRVQRVPATESMGRIHTSTATVAIMPEVGSPACHMSRLCCNCLCSPHAFLACGQNCAVMPVRMPAMCTCVSESQYAVQPYAESL